MEQPAQSLPVNPTRCTLQLYLSHTVEDPDVKEAHHPSVASALLELLERPLSAYVPLGNKDASFKDVVITDSEVGRDIVRLYFQNDTDKHDKDFVTVSLEWVDGIGQLLAHTGFDASLRAFMKDQRLLPLADVYEDHTYHYPYFDVLIEYCSNSVYGTGVAQTHINFEVRSNALVENPDLGRSNTQLEEVVYFNNLSNAFDQLISLNLALYTSSTARQQMWPLVYQSAKIIKADTGQTMAQLVVPERESIGTDAGQYPAPGVYLQVGPELFQSAPYTFPLLNPLLLTDKPPYDTYHLATLIQGEEGFVLQFDRQQENLLEGTRQRLSEYGDRSFILSSQRHNQYRWQSGEGGYMGRTSTFYLESFEAAKVILKDMIISARWESEFPNLTIYGDTAHIKLIGPSRQSLLELDKGFPSEKMAHNQKLEYTLSLNEALIIYTDQKEIEALVELSMKSSIGTLKSLSWEKVGDKTGIDTTPEPYYPFSLNIEFFNADPVDMGSRRVISLPISDPEIGLQSMGLIHNSLLQEQPRVLYGIALVNEVVGQTIALKTINDAHELVIYYNPIHLNGEVVKQQSATSPYHEPIGHPMLVSMNDIDLALARQVKKPPPFHKRMILPPPRFGGPSK